jgi:hypothetical protein
VQKRHAPLDVALARDALGGFYCLPLPNRCRLGARRRAISGPAGDLAEALLDGGERDGTPATSNGLRGKQSGPEVCPDVRLPIPLREGQPEK